MTIKIGRIPYLNAEPFYVDMERRGLELIDYYPSQLVGALERGEIDAAPLPIVDWFRMERNGANFAPLAGFCISIRERAGSLFLYSKVPINELNGARVALTDQSSTTVRLLKVLLALKHKVQPAAYVGLREPHDAFLLIGDDALRRRRGARGFPHKYDIGQEWHEWMRLPFVFARWVVRKDIPDEDLKLIEDTLYVGLEVGVDNLYHLKDPREDLYMLARDVVEYIQGFRYYIGLAEQKAMERFKGHLEELNLIPEKAA